MHARGSFDVTLTPQRGTTEPEQTIGRMLIDKRFHGDLDATSVGQMLASRYDAGAAYVALERVTGTLGGRDGSFVLMHQGTMAADSQSLTVAVAPGSGTGTLTGLAGTMQIIIEGKAHSYDLEYALPDAS